MNIEEKLKNFYGNHKYKGLIVVSILILLGILGGNIIDPEITPGYGSSYQTSLNFSLTVSANDTFYLVENTSTLYGSSGRSVQSFIILPEIASGYVPSDYNPVSCGLYWRNVNENLSVGNVSIYTGEKVVFTSDRGKSNSNLSVKCWNMPAAGTVHGTVVYSFS